MNLTSADIVLLFEMLAGGDTAEVEVVPWIPRLPQVGIHDKRAVAQQARYRRIVLR